MRGPSELGHRTHASFRVDAQDLERGTARGLPPVTVGEFGWPDAPAPPLALRGARAVGVASAGVASRFLPRRCAGTVLGRWPQVCGSCVSPMLSRDPGRVARSPGHTLRRSAPRRSSAGERAASTMATLLCALPCTGGARRCSGATGRCSRRGRAPRCAARESSRARPAGTTPVRLRASAECRRPRRPWAAGLAVALSARAAESRRRRPGPRRPPRAQTGRFLRADDPLLHDSAGETGPPHPARPNGTGGAAQP